MIFCVDMIFLLAQIYIDIISIISEKPVNTGVSAIVINKNPHFINKISSFMIISLVFFRNSLYLQWLKENSIIFKRNLTKN